MKNNVEHYRMMTNDMTDEQFGFFAQKNKDRLDEINASRILMQRLI